MNDAALNAFIDLLPDGCRAVMLEAEDALLALEVATDKEAARRDLKQAVSRLQAFIFASAQSSPQRGRP